jgi:hypothetical protein
VVLVAFVLVSGTVFKDFNFACLVGSEGLAAVASHHGDAGKEHGEGEGLT